MHKPIIDLKHAVKNFTRSLFCTTDIQTMRLYDPEYEAQAKALQADAFKKVQELNAIKARIAKTVTIVLRTEDDANYHLGVFGKSITEGGKLGYYEATRQWTKPRDHRS